MGYIKIIRFLTNMQIVNYKVDLQSVLLLLLVIVMVIIHIRVKGDVFKLLLSNQTRPNMSNPKDIKQISKFSHLRS